MTKPDHLPGRILALDLGTKTIGLALSDPRRTIVSPFRVLERHGLKKDLSALAEIIRNYQVTEIVLGVPLHLDGRESIGAKRSRDFASRLKKEFSLPVHLIDESLTTVQADEHLIRANLSRKKRKKVVDSIAATFILISYLNELSEKVSQETVES